MTPPWSPPSPLRASLESAFFIRFTTTGRHSGLARVTETTYVWDGDRRLYISGYPGRRDWIANMEGNARVRVHTVEGAWYDVPAQARVIRERNERIPHLLRFLDRWAMRPEAPRSLFGLALSAIRLNQRLGLPWWGPFYLARTVLDRMPCAELTFSGPPTPRSSAPPGT